jgi:hypothetical protein
MSKIVGVSLVTPSENERYQVKMHKRLVIPQWKQLQNASNLQWDDQNLIECHATQWFQVKISMILCISQ